jgi:hypothetical protein
MHKYMLKITVFWDDALHTLLEVEQHLRGV